jgi:hypothetical protein
MKYDEVISRLISNLTQTAIFLLNFNFIIKKDKQVILSPKNLKYFITNFH